MDIEKLIRKGKGFSRKRESIEDELIQDLTTALSTIQAKKAEMQKQLNEFSEVLCHLIGEMSSENEKLRAELEQVTRERDAAIGDIYSGNANDCDTCLHGCDYNNDCPLETGGECKYKWRGLQREN